MWKFTFQIYAYYQSCLFAACIMSTILFRVADSKHTLRLLRHRMGWIPWGGLEIILKRTWEGALRVGLVPLWANTVMGTNSNLMTRAVESCIHCHALIWYIYYCSGLHGGTNIARWMLLNFHPSTHPHAIVISETQLCRNPAVPCVRVITNIRSILFTCRASSAYTTKKIISFCTRGIDFYYSTSTSAIAASIHALSAHSLKNQSWVCFNAVNTLFFYRLGIRIAVRKIRLQVHRCIFHYCWVKLQHYILIIRCSYGSLSHKVDLKVREWEETTESNLSLYMRQL